MRIYFGSQVGTVRKSQRYLCETEREYLSVVGLSEVGLPYSFRKKKLCKFPSPLPRLSLSIAPDQLESACPHSLCPVVSAIPEAVSLASLVLHELIKPSIARATKPPISQKTRPGK